MCLCFSFSVDCNNIVSYPVVTLGGVDTLRGDNTLGSGCRGVCSMNLVTDEGRINCGIFVVVFEGGWVMVGRSSALLSIFAISNNAFLLIGINRPLGR